MPDTNAEWMKIADDYFSKWNYPNCIGALDGKHVTIRCPRNSGSLNFNYKHTFSVVLLALVDANYKFIYVDVGCKGRISDGGIFNRSTLSHAIDTGSLSIPPPRSLPGSDIETPFVILADDAFALKTYLMKPYNFRGQNRQELIFNYRLSRARRMVESTFGMIAARFRVLRTNIELSEKSTINCILAICVLHNWLLTIEPIGGREIIINEASNQAIENSNENNSTDEAKEIRDKFKRYFSSSAGEVPWQDDMV